MPEPVRDKVIHPAFLHMPPRDDSLGEDIADLADICGLTLDAWQIEAVDALMGLKDGRASSLESALICPRQNGKSDGILLPITLYAALSKPDQLVVWSAHRYKAAQESFLSMLKLYKRDDGLNEFAEMVERVTAGTGEEAFHFRNGSRIVFVSRSGASGRGLSGDLVILDEGLFLTDAMMGALFPTMSAREDPRIIYASSAGLATSTILVGIRERGRTGNDPSLAYVEYCSPEGRCARHDCDHAKSAQGCQADDPAAWREANPAPRVTIDYVASERRALPVREFLRERMGWWESTDVGGLFHMPDWWHLTDNASQPGERVWLGMHVTPDRSAAAIAAASMRGDGTLHVELTKDGHREGVGWVARWLVDRFGMHRDIVGVALAGAMAAGALAPDLEHLPGYKPLNSTETRRACAALYDAVASRSGLAHPANPDLDDAVKAARRSSDRGEWVFDASPGTDLSPLYAVALAAWAARTESEAEVSVHTGDWQCDTDDCPCPEVVEPGLVCTACEHMHREPDDDFTDDDTDEAYGLVIRSRY